MEGAGGNGQFAAMFTHKGRDLEQNVFLNIHVIVVIGAHGKSIKKQLRGKVGAGLLVDFKQRHERSRLTSSRSPRAIRMLHPYARYPRLAGPISPQDAVDHPYKAPHNPWPDTNKHSLPKHP